jgi:hypothetical protein
MEQTRRIVRRINEALENKEYCSAAFLDISQAFDRIRHAGLLGNLIRLLPFNYFLILKSHLYSRYFLVKVENEYIELSSFNAGVPQGSVLGPLLYLLQTAELPTSLESIIANCADDTAVLATDSDPAIASHKIQTKPLANEDWFRKWKMKANGSRSTHVTFTTRNEMCSPPPPVHNSPPRGRCQVSRATPWHENYLTQTHFRNWEATRNHPHQNVWVTRTQVKTLYKQKTSHI